MPDNEISVDTFLGIKNDTDAKQTPSNFLTVAMNFNYPTTGVKGLQKILFPSRVNELGTAAKAIDGLFEYRYLSSGGTLTTEYIGVTNGTIYKTILGTEVSLKTGLTAGRCSFVTFQDNLFIANGKNYINVYYGSLGVVAEMGAPAAVATGTAGNPNGTYYYAMTYVTAAGEEVLGSVSNTLTVSSKKINLTLPIGYPGTLTRNIYRTVASGTALKLLASIADNTTLTYLDDVADGSLTTSIPATGNNELPKPYFITVANQKLYATKVDKYPTQVFITDTNNQVIDVGVGLDVANYGDDNTAINGIAFDYNKVILGTGRNIIFIDPVTGEVVRTRGYVGIKDGYSMKLVPSFGEFPGGLMFVSTLNDVRLLQGTQSAAVFQTIDNIRTDNWAQNIRGDLDKALASYSNITAEFFDNKYHLVIDNTKFVFDIRINGWTEHLIKSATYTSTPRVLAVLNNKLYNGQSDGWIELEYQNIQYRSEDVEAWVQSPFIEASQFYKWVKKFYVWFTSSNNSTINMTVTLDENNIYPISASFTLVGGIFSPTYFNNMFFLTDESTMDYKVFNINLPCRWIQFTISCTTGNITLQKFSVLGEMLPNKEVA